MKKNRVYDYNDKGWINDSWEGDSFVYWSIDATTSTRF
jgi:hypothetical protein